MFRLYFLAVFYLILVVTVPAFAETTPIRVCADGHWLEFRGRKVLLVGDSVTQGWMELGTNFKQNAYVDALTTRGINVLMLWAYIGIVDQKADSRIGYDAPEVWPWIRTGGTFNLTQFNDVYFNRLRAVVQYANTKDIVVLITIHDGWTKTRFSGHPFNADNGGPLTDRSQYVELANYYNEMPTTFNPAWNRQQKHQYFLERFSDRLIQATGDQPNVMYEIFNEGEWYNQRDLRTFQIHFVNFFKARTPRLILVNDDHVGGPDFHDEPNVDIISLHRPNWKVSSEPERTTIRRRLMDKIKVIVDHVFPRNDMLARKAFTHYASKFKRSPAKPYFFSEPVPSYSGNLAEHDDLMRLMWGTALGGAGIVLQNDTSFGFDPNAAIVTQAANRDIILDLEGHLSRFFNNSGVDFGAMAPDGSLASTGVVLAKANHEYVVYSQRGPSFTVDLSNSTGNFIARFYNPRTGVFQPSFSVAPGSPSQLITKPGSRDWVLHLVLAPETR